MNRTEANQRFSLRMLPSIRDQVKQMAKDEGVSLSQFVNITLAEKLSRFESAVIASQRSGINPAQLYDGN